MPKGNILVFCAHNDDQVIGAGGALAKYAREGYAVKSVIFSFGESSHPHLKPGVIIKLRIRESLDADKIMGGAGVAYLNAKEGKFEEYIESKKLKERIIDMLKKEKPVKVFAHSINDPHPDHRVVAQLIKELLPVIPCSVYTFEVWTLWKFHHRTLPRLIVDISDTFKIKLATIRAHRSQRVAIANLFLAVLIKAKLNGIRYGYKYAEVFTKLK